MAADGTMPARHPAAAADLPLWRRFRLTPCEHGTADLVRLRRPEWMRVLLPYRRLYKCPHCGARIVFAR